MLVAVEFLFRAAVSDLIKDSLQAGMKSPARILDSLALSLHDDNCLVDFLVVLQGSVLRVNSLVEILFLCSNT